MRSKDQGNRRGCYLYHKGFRSCQVREKGQNAGPARLWRIRFVDRSGRREYDFFMRVHRGTCARGLLAVLLGAVLACHPTPSLAAEFYSWIDPAGTMVMTDNLSLIPPATQRSPVSVHRFLDRPPLPPLSEKEPEPRHEPNASPPADLSQKPVVDQAKFLAVDPALLDLPNVLLEKPGEAVKAEYVWVPLLSPIYLGASPVPGFWCLRTVTDPGAALKDHLSRHQGQVVIGGRPWYYSPVGPPFPNVQAGWGHLLRNGNPFQERALRLQQALSQPRVSRGQPAPVAGPAVTGNGRASGRR